MKRILTYTTFCLLLVFASCSEEQLEVYHGRLFYLHER